MGVTTASPLVSDRFAVPPEPVLPLTIEQYHEMARAEILRDGDPIELLEGWLVRKMTKSPAHSAATAEARRALEPIIPEGWSVDAQEPITTADSEPEPDVSVIRGRRRDLADRHPRPDEVAVLVEVADASLDRDRGWKKRIYAAAQIPVYWIVNLVDGQIEVHSEPLGPGDHPDYALRQVFCAGDIITVALGGNEVGQIAVNDLLP